MRADDSKSLKAGFVEIMEAKIFSGELKPWTDCRRSASLLCSSG